MKQTWKLLFYLVVALLLTAAVIAGLVSMIGLSEQVEHGNPSGEVPGQVSQTPEGTEPSATPSGTPGPVIVVTPKPYVPVTPAPTPKPTPKPTPTPKPVVSLGSGTISSDTGTWINVDAKWSAESVNNNSARIKVVVNLRSYGLHSVAGSKTLSISVGGQSVALNVKALEIDSDTEVTTELGSASFTVSAPAGQTTTIPVEAGWHFGGVYSGVELDVISAAGEIAIKR